MNLNLFSIEGLGWNSSLLFTEWVNYKDDFYCNLVIYKIGLKIPNLNWKIKARCMKYLVKIKNRRPCLGEETGSIC